MTSPEATDPIAVEHGFVRHQSEIGERCLGDEHPVERVAEGTRQISGRLSVLHRDRQLEKGLKCKRPRDIYRKGRRLG